MSRIPQRPPRSPTKQSTPIRSGAVPASSAPRSRTQSTTTVSRSATPTKTNRVRPKVQPEDVPPTPSLSIKDVIAMKRAEVRKAQSQSRGGLDNLSTLEDALPTAEKQPEEEDILGRAPIRETIERARSTGSLNLATRSLPCIPSALFEIHLGVTPDSLKLVPEEPALPLSEPHTAPRRGGRHNSPAWFEAQDLTVLKACNNEILEIQHEISLFGSLKVVDLHENKLSTLPDSFGDLTALTSLDLSHNALTTLPKNIFALPELVTLNISHNSLEDLPFNAPFSDSHSNSKQYQSSAFFTPTISRAISPLPRLLFLNASHNKIAAAAIDATFPASITKLDLSANPIAQGNSECHFLLRTLADLPKLKEIRFEQADIGDTAFPDDPFSPESFPSLCLLDLGETRTTLDVVKQSLSRINKELNFDFTRDEPPSGVIRVLVGKRVLREAWELEVERRTKTRVVQQVSEVEDIFGPPSVHKTPVGRVKEVAPVVKEQWEIDAEQGLLTEGGKRRARAAVAATAESQTRNDLGLGTPSTPSADRVSPPLSTGYSLTGAQYYSAQTQTLTLPPSTPPTKLPGHGRAFSLATPSSHAPVSSRSADLAVPTPTLPLTVILAQPYSASLKILSLVNRRMDRSFVLPYIPESPAGYLPNLEELDLEGCSLADLVTVTRSNAESATGGTSTPPRSTELLLPLLSGLFPSIRSLNLAYNALTSESLTVDALSTLILAHAPHRSGLRHLRLRGNRLTDLSGLQAVAGLFRGNRAVSTWKLEEIDLRDNEIGKLPAELGLLPLDVFLVDGNTFRVPQRRIWEREGTKGLLSWLRGRIE